MYVYTVYIYGKLFHFCILPCCMLPFTYLSVSIISVQIIKPENKCWYLPKRILPKILHKEFSTTEINQGLKECSFTQLIHEMKRNV